VRITGAPVLWVEPDARRSSRIKGRNYYTMI